MADVVLSDYLAFVFSEISRARDMADRSSKAIALVYAQDDILRHFSVPRFKLAKLDLTMPVLVSGLQLSSLAKFSITRDDFRTLILSKVADLLASVVKPKTKVDAARVEGLEPLIDALHEQLAGVPDAALVDNLVSSQWSETVAKSFEINKVPSDLAASKAVAAQIESIRVGLIETVRSLMTVTKVAIEKLLINPETNVVKDGSNGTSVFTLKAELVEEGVLIKRVKDETTGMESVIVEFE